MKTLNLTRAYLPHITLGTLSYQSLILYTVEKPWRSNIPFESCIPNGDYSIQRHHTKSHPDCFILINHNLGVGAVKGETIRYACLFHIANWVRQVQGCIGPGLEFHPNTWGVASSRKAMLALNKLIDPIKEDWTLRII